MAGVPSGRTRRPGRPSEASPRLRFTLLGPVRAWRGEERLSIGSPQQRALLATLLLRGGRTVLAGELVDALWGDEPPHAALAALRTYASRLRNVLGPDGNALVSESGGYAIRVGHGCLDIDKAEHLATEAEKSRAAGDRTRARELINEALGVWDGEPLAGLPGPYAETQRARLEEWRLTLIETRLDLDLEVGAHAEAVSELTALTAAHPLREWLRKLLMLALYRSGRQAEALAVYTDTRRLLADELGIEPNPELAELQQRILRADPGLTLNSAADRSSPDPGFTRPTQLPAMVPDFTGRESFVAELIEQLVTAEGRIMAVSAVAGMGGAGKTTLAVHVAHAARHHFPDGQLYADLQGTGPVPAEPEAVLGSFLRALGVPDSAIPDGLQERTALFRSTLDGRRVLALLDNARDAAQLRPLLPIAEGCAALITSRRRMLDLAGARLVDLGVLSADEALALFTRIVGQERVGAGRDAAMDVVAACGFLPLAIRIAASRLAARRTWTVSVLAHKLADERRRLDELRAGDLAVKATFELGYGQLEPAQARAFRLLALPAGPDIGLEAAAALLDREAGTTEDLLESLVDLSLMETPGPGRYRCHDLLRTYARHRSPAGAEEDEALLRLHRFHLASARAAFVVTRPGDRSLAYLRDTGSPGLEFATHDAALDWVCGEAGNLLAAVQQAVAHPSDEALGDAVDTLWAVGDLLESGKWEEAYSRAAGALVAAAGQRGAVVAEGRARCLLGRLAAVAGRFEEAGTEALRAGSSARETGDRLVLVQALILRSTVARHRHAYEEAERCLEAALEEYRADGDRYGEAAVLADLARTHAETGAGERAVEEARRSVRAFRELGAVSRLGDSLYTLGLALERLGQRDDAFVALDEARTLFIRARQGLCEGMALFRMAENCLGRGQPSRAAQFAQRALTALETVGGDRRRASVLTLLGRAFHDLNRLDEARSCWTTALGLFEPLGASEAATVRTLLGEAPMARRA
ncbi:AfsR/SARP family transcriptional regulator [Streptomyces sp. NPDC020379]|uniref:AfsR/SARP family transcriptional regulator n=1 Tax=Streptomyces sp. NPDC020379 TaxID=3365071 RepID=UPI00379B2905